jgi:Protein of unknown function (DUF1549)/Protein of unknown function (DUF1553)/Planctomycete cytochrome C
MGAGGPSRFWSFEAFMRMTQIIRCSIWVSVGLLMTGIIAAQENDKEPWSQADLNFFETKIRPVLIDKCYSCHSDQATSIAAGLRVDSRAGLLRGGDSGPAVEPGNPQESLLLEALHYGDEDYAMPPRNAGGKLPDDVIKNFEDWVKRGLPDPRKESEVGPDPGAGEKAKSWWAYQPLSKPSVPTPTNASWSANPIDRFVMQRLEEKKLQPVGDAEPATLLRRVYFDLTGLPPSPEDAKRFVADWQSAKDSDSQLQLYTAVVDRLLASPQYGEHWGRHWLDVARYAESSGKDLNVLYPYAWRYRDYVIDAFNSDMPYDQFVQEQIAGDLLKSKDDEEKARQMVATGFLAIGPKSINEQKARQLAVDIADEQLDSVTQAFLGETVACARCHDHKFDPISQVDYTALAGIFLSTQTHYGTIGGVAGRNAGTLMKLPISDSTPQSRPISTEELQKKKDQLAELEKERQQMITERMRDRDKKENDINRVLRVSSQIQAVKASIASYNENGEKIAQAMGVADKPSSSSASGSGRFFAKRRGDRGSSGFVSIGDSPLFVRGEVDRPSEKVKRGLPSLFPGLEPKPIPRNASGRKELSEWVTDPKNPLASRVMVNRIWHWLFGAGIVTSVDNFGTTGAEPTHPELLDYLANRFIENDWSIKKTIREVVLSRSYRMSSAYNETAFRADPGNEFIWRHNPKRLEAEAIRDSILMASRQLNLERPVASDISRAGDGVLGRARFGVSEESILMARTSARSIYLPLTRNVEPEILGVFDYPDASAVQGARQSTNVPAQVLFMLNSQYVEEQCRRIAGRVSGNPLQNQKSRVDKNRPATKQPKKDFEETFDDLCWLVYSRPATSKETSAAKKLSNMHRDDPMTGAISVIRAMIASAEFRSLD